ncbi:MAG: MarR family transcriptional regulator [Candidatus Saccharibacteria bacterium]|nr:MarR family transcriptional regulator [Rhodoferax sp.]
MPKFDSDSALQLDNQLCFAVYSASLAMTKLYTPLLSALQLTYPQYLVLLVLWEQDGLSVTALGERLHLNSGTLTPLLKRMEASSLLLRKRSQEDERRVMVSLTPKGKQLKSRAAAIPPCVAEASDCSLTALMALTQQLKALRNRLQYV